MNIGFVSGEFAPMPGGVGEFTRILAEHTLDLGHVVHVLSREGCSSDSLTLMTVREWGLRCIAPLRTWANDNGIDLINLQFQTAAFDMSPLIHFLPSLLDQPLVTTFHDLRHPYLFPKAGRLRDWIVMHLARSSDAVIATNPEDGALLDHLPRRNVIPIGSLITSHADARDARSKWRRKLNVEDSTFVLGHFGFVKEIKGLDYLVDAIAELAQRGRKLKLVLIGGQHNAVDVDEDASYLEQLNKRIAGLGLETLVHWTGYLPDSDVAAGLQAVDLMVLPFLDGASYRRSSLMAAINYGCAILTTHPAIAYDTFNHGVNMWLVSCHSASAIADAIDHLIQHPQQLTNLRQGALELRPFFAWDAIAQKTVTFFEEVLCAAGH